MSTRATIARIRGDGFAGVYHHFDGYPSGLGATLFKRAQEVEVGDMLHFLIDEHPAGWSTINDADWAAPPGFSENGFSTEGPACYCHGGRSEGAMTITHEDDTDAAWAYVLDAHAKTMAVLERADGGRVLGFFWRPRAVVALSGPEPDWASMGGYAA